MSRIGKMPITPPKSVSVTVDGNTVTIKGPRGELKRTIDPLLNVAYKDGSITIGRQNDEKQARQLHGLTRTLVNNMVIGVTDGYQKTLDIVGVGYRVAAQGKNIALQVGYSKPKVVEPMSGVLFAVEGQNRIHVRGSDKDAVGLMAAKVRRVRPPDLYKGKGIRYAGEVVRLKAGKGAAAKKA